MEDIKIKFIFLFSFLFARDYFISFTFVNINSQLVVNEFNCAEALSVSSCKRSFLFSLPLKKDIKTTCNVYKEKIIDNLIKKGIIVYANEKRNKSYIRSRVKVTFLPRRFDIIIKNGVVKFYLKE